MNFTHWLYRPGSVNQYKNVTRTILMASIARSMGLRFSVDHGLEDRKTGKPLSKGTNPDYIAQRLLNKNASKKDLSSIETILASLKNDPERDEKLADARKMLPTYGVPPEIMQ